jgi:XRE family transcriptional regulator, master regulator for biofilm formation
VIGNTIYEFRKQKGLSLSELAKRADISKSYLSNIERNLNRNPSIEVVQRIAKVLEIELDTILNPLKNKVVKREIDQDLIDFATELKESGIDKEKFKEYKALIDFIKWQNKGERAE